METNVGIDSQEERWGPSPPKLNHLKAYAQWILGNSGDNYLPVFSLYYPSELSCNNQNYVISEIYCRLYAGIYRRSAAGI